MEGPLPRILPRSASSFYEESVLKIVTVIQARMGSSRFPGKVLKPLGDSNILLEICRRVRAARHCGEVVVATSDLSEDDLIADTCLSQDIPFWRGDVSDLLDRHYQCAVGHRADAVVKIPSDCPLIDPKVIDRVIGTFLQYNGSVDYVSNLHPPSYPDGNDVEIFTMKALKVAWTEAESPTEREHTTPFFWTHPERFRLANVEWESGRDVSDAYRITLDYVEDYELICRIHNALSPLNKNFGVNEVIAYLDSHREVKALNEAYLGETWITRQGLGPEEVST